jgi:hypothetical protein
MPPREDDDMRATMAMVLVTATATGVGCASRRASAPRIETSASGARHDAGTSTTTTPYVFFEDGTGGTFVTRVENVYGPDAAIYDVRDLSDLRGAVEVVLLKLPEMAREQGATLADFNGGALRIAGPPKAHSLVREILAMLRASPGPRLPACHASAASRPEPRATPCRR